MILEKIELLNFRSYYGHHEIELRANGHASNRPVTVVGGLNGSGKTSLLDGIIYTLLGVVDAFNFMDEVQRRGSGKQVIDRALDGIINREARDQGERESSVALHFSEPDGNRFMVQRAWIYDPRGRFKNEQLIVRSGGTDLTEDQYGDFLKNRVPPEVVKFFFFDGEKIQDIAKDEVGDSVVQGINSLLGFHKLDALKADMDKKQDEYRSQANKRNRQEEELGEFRAQETKFVNQIRESEDKQVDLEETVLKLASESRELLDELNQQFGGEGASPKEIQRQLSETEATVRRLNEDILQMVDSWIVPAMAPKLLTELNTQLAAEEERAQWEEGMHRVQPQRERLLDKVFGERAPESTPPLESSQADFLCNRIRFEWDELFNPPPPGIAKVVLHDFLSTEERRQVQSKCGQTLRSGNRDVRAIFNKLDSAERLVNTLRQKLEAIGDGERVTEILERKAKVDKQLGEAEQAWETIKRNIQAVSTDLKDIRRQIKNKEEDLLESGRSDEKANFVRRVKKAIQKYQEILRPKKRDEVAAHLSDMYRHLARKEDVVERIELDEETFRPKLLDRKGGVIPLHSLSAGEREIYALSLLWALGKTSRRALPVVIDTPLARLDSEHRSTIVKRYLPQAGPQVIVLSTDTEIDHQYFQLIEDHLGKSLRLEFDPLTERTTVSDGYFVF
ncbi:MAG: DNA sulfur modification protein DndD [Planctomycetota bacterium]|nr:DNA sulfur modification protein DndD [Planctomycetota bacterium]